MRQAAALAKTIRDSGCRIVLAHGCWDLLHVGHIRHLQTAKSYGEVLIVTVTPDHFVNKGPKRPVFPMELRIECLLALKCVDYVFPNEWETAVETIKAIRPRFYAKGADCLRNETEGFKAEKIAVAAVGGKIIFTEEIEFHSTDLIRKVVDHG